MANYLTVDIGGTFIKYALLNDSMQLIHRKKTPTPVNDDQAIAKQVAQIAADCSVQFDLAGIGISTAGIVDRRKGEIIYAGPTIKAYKGTNFKQALASLNLPVHVANDVDCALLGEQWKGAAKQQDNVFCITLGTGIGGAWYYQNDLVDGAYFQANSTGYLLYDPVTQTNFEMRASTKALNEQITHKLGNGWNTEQVFTAAKQGNPACSAVISNWALEVAAGLAQIILICDPDCIIIGGGVSAQGEFLQNQIQQHIPAFLPADFMKTAIKTAALHNDAALYGALHPFFN